MHGNKYNINKSWLKTIDTEEKAWFLGWVASDGTVTKNGVIRIKLNAEDRHVCDQLKNLISTSIEGKWESSDDTYGFEFNSIEMSQDIGRHLKFPLGKKYDVIQFPELSTKELTYHFLRGFFEGDGCVSSISSRTTIPVVDIVSYSEEFLSGLIDMCDVKPFLTNKRVVWKGLKALDILGKMYDNANYYLNRKRDIYIDWAAWQPSLTRGSSVDSTLYFNRTRKDAVPPFKNLPTDSGYDLTLLEKIKTNGEVEFYDTGIKVKPAVGFYFDLVPRSSLVKTGYILANSVGIIDRSYRGNVLVPLVKIDKSAKDLELPGRYVQLIPRRAYALPFIEVKDLDETARGENGFGSSGK